MKIEKEHEKSTLMNMSKNQLSELVMCLEYNNNGLHDVINHQYKSFIALLPKWIPVEEQLPACEEEVEVTTVRHYKEKTIYLTCRAIYEDGTIWGEDSAYCWEDLSDYEYDEERDDYRVPEGWFEAVSYAEQFEIIDDKVIAWRKRPEPYKPE